MKHRQVFFVATALALVPLAGAKAAHLKIIANPSVAASAASADEIKRVFLLTTNELNDGSRVEPVVTRGGQAHEVFLRDYLSKTDLSLQVYYRTLVFTGKASMPKTLGTEADVAAYVARTKGAIGYVSPGQAAPGTKTLEVK